MGKAHCDSGAEIPGSTPAQAQRNYARVPRVAGFGRAKLGRSSSIDATAGSSADHFGTPNSGHSRTEKLCPPSTTSELLELTFKEAMHGNSRLSHFLRAWSRRGSTARLSSAKRCGGGLFPCLPPEISLGKRPKSGRRLTRWRRRALIARYTRLLIGVGSFIATGFSRRPPTDLVGCTSEAHLEMVKGIEERVRHFVRLGSGLSPDPGSGRKGMGVAETIKSVSKNVKLIEEAAAQLKVSQVTGDMRRLMNLDTK